MVGVLSTPSLFEYSNVSCIAGPWFIGEFLPFYEGPDVKIQPSEVSTSNFVYLL